MVHTILKIGTAAALSAAVLACDLPLELGDCSRQDDRSGSLDAAGLERVLIEAGAGTLEVIGRSGLDRITVEGQACASTSSLLSQIEIDLDREGDLAQIVARIPETSGSSSAGLDLVIEVPRSMVLQVHDGSGTAEIQDVAALEVFDGPGRLVIDEIAGDLTVSDGSGSVDIADIGGMVRVYDGSGDIRIRAVSGDVLIFTDGSGDIDVANVGGDFWVGEDESGSIEFRDIDGSVDLP